MRCALDVVFLRVRMLPEGTRWSGKVKNGKNWFMGSKGALILTGCVLLPSRAQLRMVATRPGATVRGVRVPTRESEALIGTRMLLRDLMPNVINGVKLTTLLRVHRRGALTSKNRLESNGNGVRFTDIIYVCILGSEDWLA